MIDDARRTASDQSGFAFQTVFVCQFQPFGGTQRWRHVEREDDMDEYESCAAAWEI